MKRTLLVLPICLLAGSLLFPGCGDKYADAKKATEEYIALVEDYLEELDGAGDAQDVARAMNRFTDELEDLWPRMQKISEQYPELKGQGDLPPELRESQKRAEEIGARLAGSMMKLMPYMGDPGVQQAQRRMGEVMASK